MHIVWRLHREVNDEVLQLVPVGIVFFVIGYIPTLWAILGVMNKYSHAKVKIALFNYGQSPFGYVVIINFEKTAVC